jgi:hypothetical protein
MLLNDHYIIVGLISTISLSRIKHRIKKTANGVAKKTDKTLLQGSSFNTSRWKVLKCRRGVLQRSQIKMTSIKLERVKRRSMRLHVRSMRVESMSMRVKKMIMTMRGGDSVNCSEFLWKRIRKSHRQPSRGAHMCKCRCFDRAN